MKDIQLSNLIKDLVKEEYKIYGITIPAFIIRITIYRAFSKIFTLMQSEENCIELRQAAITRIRELHDGSRYITDLKDIDETKLFTPHQLALRTVNNITLSTTSNRQHVLQNPTFYSGKSGHRKSVSQNGHCI